MNEFQERLRKLRTLKDMTQEQVSMETGIKKFLLSSFERGKDIPDAPTLKTIASFFNVSMDYLWGETQIVKEPIPTVYIDELIEGTSPYQFTLDGIKISQEEWKQAKEFVEFKRYKKETEKQLQLAGE